MLPVVPTRSDKRSSIRHSPVEPDQCLVPIYPERFCMIQVQGIADTGQSKGRSEEHTSELQSLMRISYADFCLKNKTDNEPEQLKTHINRRHTRTHTTT